MNKKNIILFIGAGASASFGKPTTAKLKDILHVKYGDGIRVDFLRGLLSCPDLQDFEYTLAAAMEIRDFINSPYGGKFIRFLTQNNGLFVYREDLSPNYYMNFKESIEGWNKIVTTLEDEVYENYRWDHGNDSAVKAIYDPIIHYLNDTSNEIVICTTNYDRAIENFCEQTTFRCIDGFQNIKGSYRWSGTFYYPPKDNTEFDIVLYKIHGSLDWKRRRVDQLILRTGEEGRPIDSNYFDNQVIYPTLSPKHEHENDLLKKILEEFKKKMSIADVCIVIGFSFRDEYLADIFRDFIAKKKLFIVISDSSSEKVYRHLLKKEPPDLHKSNVYQDTENKNIVLIRKHLSKDKAEEIKDDIKKIIDS